MTEEGGHGPAGGLEKLKGRAVGRGGQCVDGGRAVEAEDPGSKVLRGAELPGEAGLLAEAGGVTKNSGEVKLVVGRLSLSGGEQQQRMIPSWDRAAHLKRERERLMVMSSLLSGDSVLISGPLDGRSAVSDVGLEQLKAQCPTPRTQDYSQEKVPKAINKHEAVVV